MSNETPFGLTPTPGNKAVIEYLEATKELATAAPSVAKEMLRILESEQRPAAPTRLAEAATTIDVNAHGDWVQPPAHVVFSTAAVRPAPLPRALPSDKRSDTPCKVFSHVSHSKQRKGTTTK